MYSTIAKKQEECNQKKVRDLLRLPENKKCFDCPTKGPAYVNTTIQTFVCARCSGLVREAGHRVKSVSASKFSGPEALALMMGGNGVGQKIWLSNYSTLGSPEPEADDDVRAFMRQKYYENKWLDRNLLLSHNQQIRKLISQSFNEDGQPIKPNTKITMGHTNTAPIHVVPSTSFTQPLQPPKIPLSPTTTISFERKRSSMDSQRSSISSSSEKYAASVYSNASGNRDYAKDSYSSGSNRQSMDSARSSVCLESNVITEYHNEVNINSVQETSNPIKQTPKLSKLANFNNNIPPTSVAGLASSTVTPTITKTRPLSATSDAFDSIISDLTGLKLEKTVKRATYTGGILSPSSTTPLKPIPVSEKENDNLFDSDFFSKFNPAKKNETSESDQYAALRGIPAPTITSTVSKEEEKHTSSSEDDDEDDWQDFCSSSNFEEDNNDTEIPVAEKVEIDEPVVAIDFFSDLDPRSMFKKF